MAGSQTLYASETSQNSFFRIEKGSLVLLMTPKHQSLENNNHFKISFWTKNKIFRAQRKCSLLNRFKELFKIDRNLITYIKEEQ